MTEAKETAAQIRQLAAGLVAGAQSVATPSRGTTTGGSGKATQYEELRENVKRQDRADGERQARDRGRDGGRGHDE